MPNTQTLLAQAYSAFNHRDIDSALALMSENVSWPKASEGGRVVGKEEIRFYWTRQWKEFDPDVEPLEVRILEGQFCVPNVCQLRKSQSRWAQVRESQFAKALSKTHYLELSNGAERSPARLQNLYSSVRFRSPPPKTHSQSIVYTH